MTTLSDRPQAEHTPVYLDTADAVAAFARSIAREPLVALDTEGASFHRFVDRIYLMQLSTRSETAVVDPLPIGPAPELGAIVEDPAVEIILHDADYDVRLLRQDYGWRVKNVFDTRVAAQLLGIRAFGLAALLERFFNLKLEKKFQRADWSLRPLTAGMLAYAAQDTMYLPALRDELKAELERKGRWAWAQEEFLLIEETHWADEEPGVAFMRMKGARDLTRRELAVLRELFAWRESVAAEQDRATFRVIGNEPLLDLSRLAPTTREALASVKGMPRGVLEMRAADMLAAIRRGLDVRDADLPKFPRAARWDRDPGFDARVSMLKTARDAAATSLDVDPGVLCARERLEAVARKNPRTMSDLESVSELRRWQVSVLGDDFLRALAGRTPSPQLELEPPNSADDSPYADG